MAFLANGSAIRDSYAKLLKGAARKHSANSVRHWRLALEQLFPDSGAYQAYIIGCEPGILPLYLKKKGWHVHVGDLSEKLLLCFSGTAASHGYGFPIHTLDGQTLPCEDESYDLVVLQNISGFFENPDRLYAEIFRALKPGGRFIQLDPDLQKQTMAERFRELGLPEDDAVRLGDAWQSLADAGRPGFEDRLSWDTFTLRSHGFIYCSAQKLSPVNLNEILCYKPVGSPWRTTEHLLRQVKFAEQKLLEEFDLSYPVYQILRMIDTHEEGVRPSAVADRLHIPRQTMSRIIGSLTGEGLLTQTLDSIDKRSFLVTFTPRGKEYFRKIREKKDCFFSFVSEQVTDEEICQVNEIFQKLLRRYRDFSSI